MAKRIIKFSIDVTKIDKRRIVEKDGRKWYNFTAIENETKYSDWMLRRTSQPMSAIPG